MIFARCRITETLNKMCFRPEQSKREVAGSGPLKQITQEQFVHLNTTQQIQDFKKRQSKLNRQRPRLGLPQDRTQTWAWTRSNPMSLSKALAVALSEARRQHPELSVTRVVVHKETEVSPDHVTD